MHPAGLASIRCCIYDEGDVIDALHKEGLNAYSTINRPGKIFFDRRDTIKFLDYIGPPPVSCYEYKWQIPTKRPRKPQKRHLKKRNGYGQRRT